MKMKDVRQGGDDRRHLEFEVAEAGVVTDDILNCPDDASAAFPEQGEMCPEIRERLSCLIVGFRLGGDPVEPLKMKDQSRAILYGTAQGRQGIGDRTRTDVMGRTGCGIEKVRIGVATAVVRPKTDSWPAIQRRQARL
jgi:hypothetical protein